MYIFTDPEGRVSFNSAEMNICEDERDEEQVTSQVTRWCFREGGWN